MASKTEKITIELDTDDLAQIDELVDAGNYAGRADFLSAAIHIHLDAYKGLTGQQAKPDSVSNGVEKAVGAYVITKKALEQLAEKGKKLNISVTGVLTVDANVGPELFVRTVENVQLRGKLVANADVKMLIEQMNL